MNDKRKQQTNTAITGTTYSKRTRQMMTREEELMGMIATLDQENRQLRARNERLQKEMQDLEDVLNKALALMERRN